MSPSTYDPAHRAAEKQRSRASDDEALASGSMSRQQVAQKNAFIKAEWTLHVNLASAPIAG